MQVIPPDSCRLLASLRVDIGSREGEGGPSGDADLAAVKASEREKPTITALHVAMQQRGIMPR